MEVDFKVSKNEDGTFKVKKFVNNIYTSTLTVDKAFLKTQTKSKKVLEERVILLESRENGLSHNVLFSKGLVKARELVVPYGQDNYLIVCSPTEKLIELCQE